MNRTQDLYLLQKIENALSEIRPYLQDDGGDIELVELTDDMIAKVRLIGACSTCPISLQTLKNGVEQTIKSAVPDVKKVVEVS